MNSQFNYNTYNHILLHKSAEKAAPPKKKAKTDDKKKSSSSSSKKSSSSSSSNGNSQSSAEKKPRTSLSSKPIGTDPNDSEDFYNNTEKGKLIQRLLVRWWYAIQWPDASALLSPPDGFEDLPGFEGIYVGTREDNLGEILDKRDKNTAPTLMNMNKKNTEELKILCEKAYEEQIKSLVAAEGEDTKLERVLRTELREVRAINAEKADRQSRGFSFKGHK